MAAASLAASPRARSRRERVARNPIQREPRRQRSGATASCLAALLIESWTTLTSSASHRLHARAEVKASGAERVTGAHPCGDRATDGPTTLRPLALAAHAPTIAIILLAVVEGGEQ